MWKEMLSTLQDISKYLETQDNIEKQIVQEKADMPKAPKVAETQEPLKGEGSVVGAPETDRVVTKEFVAKAEEKEDEDEDEKSESETDKEEAPAEDVELKSLLKDIRDALAVQSDVVKSEIRKALPAAVDSAVDKKLDKTLRKMGFTPTRPDVSRLGLDQTAEVRKSEDSVVEGDIKKSEDKQENDLLKAIDDLSKNTSWQKLGQMREKAGLFRAF